MLLDYIIIKSFRIDDDHFHQTLHVGEDDRCEIIDRENKTLLIFTADCIVKTPSGDVLGRFHYTDNHIVFKADEDSDLAALCKKVDLSVPQGLETIFKLEREVFKVWYKSRYV